MLLHLGIVVAEDDTMKLTQSSAKVSMRDMALCMSVNLSNAHNIVEARLAPNVPGPRIYLCVREYILPQRSRFPKSRTVLTDESKIKTVRR